MTSDTPRWKAIPFMKTDTPNDACPHCGAEWELPEKMFACGTPVSPVLPSGRISEAFCSELCEERSTRQKLEAEVEKLKAGKVFVDPKWIYDLETQLAKAHEELCQAGLREYGN